MNYLKRMIVFAILGVLLSCSKEQPIEKINEFDFKQPTSSELQQRMTDFFIGNSSLTKSTSEEFIANYDFTSFDVLKNNKTNTTAYLTKGNENPNNVLAIWEKDGELEYFIRLEILKEEAGNIEFICFRDNVPVYRGTFNNNGVLTIDEIFNSTKASAASWGCNMGIGSAGGIMSIAIGAVFPPAGFLVGLAYAALAVFACDGL